MGWLFIALYLASCAAAFFIVCDAYREISDIELCDLFFIVLMAIFGPISLVATSIVWLFVRIENQPYKQPKVIWRKK